MFCGRQVTQARRRGCLYERCTPQQCAQVVRLKAFSKFENTTEALAAATALVDSKLSKRKSGFGNQPLDPSADCVFRATAQE
jgi:hypothetical protein